MGPALPSPDYAKRLHRAFPDVRVRWSDQNEEWLLECQVSRPYADRVDPDKYPVEAIDTFIRHRDGYQLMRPFEPHELPPIDLLIKGIEMGERWRHQKNAKERADRLDMLDQAVEEAKRQNRRATARHVGSELYDMKWTSHRPSATHHG